MFKSVGVNSAAYILKDSSKELNTEANLEFFEKSTPANLKMLEALWYAKQSSEELMSLLIKGYGGLAFGIHETKYLEDQILGNEDDSINKQNAIYHYTTAFDYGVKFFEENGIKYSTLMGKGAADTLPEILSKKLSSDDKIGAFYFAQSWGGLINLQRDNVEMLSHLGAVKAIMDWVCEDKNEFEYGSCNLFYAVYEAGRPAMLGGNLKKGQKIFLNYIKMYPENLLARVSYIQFYIIPTMDEVLYAKQAEFLKKEFLHWSGVKDLSKRTNRTKKYLKNSQFNLFNAIAMKRFRLIEKLKNEIF
jgi:hypothetical protein